MKTEEVFKQIYQDLKERIENKDNRIFIKEYKIPSINYNDSSNKKDLYFASGIEMEIERIMEQLGYEFYFASYKDRYFFSNEQSILQQKVLSEIEKEDDLKQLFLIKVEQEYKKLVEELEQKSPKEIIDRSYELVVKEQIKYELQDKNYSPNELKALLRRNDILTEFYIDWRNSEGKLGEIIQPTLEYAINTITENYSKEKREKAKESR